MPVNGFGAAGRPAFREVRAAGAAAGVALTTTAARTVIPKGTDWLELMPRNFSTAVVARWAFMPYLIILKTTDDLATVTDYSEKAQDGDAAQDVDLSSLDTLANGDYVLVGSYVPWRGIDVDVDTANGNASVLTAKYWNGTSWADISVTDGTAAAGATFGQDGQITWTVPTAWVKATLRETGLAPAAAVGKWQHEQLYWLRIEVSALLDATSKQNSWVAMPRSTTYASLATTEKFAAPVSFGPGGVAGIEALTDAGTANLAIACYSEGGFTQA